MVLCNAMILFCKWLCNACLIKMWFRTWVNEMRTRSWLQKHQEKTKRKLEGKLDSCVYRTTTFYSRVSQVSVTCSCYPLPHFGSLLWFWNLVVNDTTHGPLRLKVRSSLLFSSASLYSKTFTRSSDTSSYFHIWIWPMPLWRCYRSQINSDTWLIYLSKTRNMIDWWQRDI